MAEPASPPKRGIQWDEKAIAEHDLLRGTRMKIDEPKTPYEYMDEEQLVQDEMDEYERE
jgi:protein phosphatase inhibitor 2